MDPFLSSVGQGMNDPIDDLRFIDQQHWATIILFLASWNDQQGPNPTRQHKERVNMSQHEACLTWEFSMSNQNTILLKGSILDTVYQYWSSNLNNNQKHILLGILPVYLSSAVQVVYLEMFMFDKPSSKCVQPFTDLSLTMWHLQGSHQRFHHGHCSVQTLLSQTSFLGDNLEAN